MLLNTLHLQRLVSLQISLFPSMPVLALTETAKRDKICEIISTMGQSNSVVIQGNPNRENVFAGER